MTFCGLPPCLVESQILDESQMQWSSAGIGAVPGDAGLSRRCMNSAQLTRIRALPPDAERPSRVSLCQRSVIWYPTPQVESCLKNVAVSKGLEELAREAARVQGQAAGKEEDSETSDENVPPLVPKSAWVVSGRRHHRVRVPVDHSMCRGGSSEESLL